jgi:hypothetical protein
MHTGVYAVGHTVLTRNGRWMAAVLACGPGAVLSHRDAAALHGLRPSSRARIDVTVRGRGGRKRRGIDAHRSRRLDAADVTTVDGIPCTTVARTLVDLAEVVSPRETERACERAEILRVFDLRAVDAICGRTPGRRGVPVLTAIVRGYRATSELTKSDLEQAFLTLCANAGIPPPQVNLWIDLEGGGVEVDFVWEAEGLIVEVDGYETHGTPTAFERDRSRDVDLHLAGWQVVRFTWRQVVGEPAAVARKVKRLLAQLATTAQRPGRGSR